MAIIGNPLRCQSQPIAICAFRNSRYLYGRTRKGGVMNTELEDLERRVELLEGRLASIEHRLDAHQIHLDIVTDWHQAEREAGPSASAVDQEPRSDTPDAHFGRVESMLRQ